MIGNNFSIKNSHLNSFVVPTRGFCVLCGFWVNLRRFRGVSVPYNNHVYREKPLELKLHAIYAMVILMLKLRDAGVYVTFKVAKHSFPVYSC